MQEGLARLANQTLGRYVAPGPVSDATLSLDNPICRLMRQHPVATGRCSGHCDQAVETTLHTGRTQLFQCHAKLAVFVTQPVAPRPEPPQVTKQVLIGGKAFLAYEDVNTFRLYAEELGLDRRAVEALIPDIRVRTLEEVKAFMEQSRVIAGDVLTMEYASRQGRDQLSRIRYLMEIVPALETEPASGVPQAVLHGLGILFGVPAGLVLEQAEEGRLAVAAAFCGNSTRFSEKALHPLTFDGSVPWIRQTMEDGVSRRCDAVYDLLKAGFPAETRSVDLFPLTRTEGPSLVALINASLSGEDRAAVHAFCRHAGLHMERSAMARKLDRGAPPSGPDLTPALWETSDPDFLCKGILETSVASVDAEQGSVMLLDSEEDRLRIRAIHGINLKFVEYVRIAKGEGISGTVLARGEPLLVTDIAQEPEIHRHMRSRYKTRSFISVPIKLQDRTLGIINVADKRQGGVFTRQDLQRLIPISHQAALAIDRIEAHQKTEELRKATMTDYLTGLLNVGSFDKRLSEEVERAQRYPYANPLSLLVVDIDDFKRINDTLGYPAGDDCIKACAEALKNGTRNIDSVYRRGGEEFTVLLPHTSREAALTLAERLCRAIEEMRVVTRHTANPLSFTVSVGLATYPEDGSTDEALFNRANKALHVAKRNGKNQVVTLPPTSEF